MKNIIRQDSICIGLFICFSGFNLDTYCSEPFFRKRKLGKLGSLAHVDNNIIHIFQGLEEASIHLVDRRNICLTVRLNHIHKQRW